MRFNTIGCSRQIQQQLAGHEGTLEEFFADKIEEGTIFVADTIEELADKLGFEGEAKDTFLAEVDRYNDSLRRPASTRTSARRPTASPSCAPRRSSAAGTVRAS